MARVSVCMNLTALALPANAVEVVEGLEYLVKLQRLDLSSNRIRSLGAEWWRVGGDCVADLCVHRRVAEYPVAQMAQSAGKPGG